MISVLKKKKFGHRDRYIQREANVATHREKAILRWRIGITHLQAWNARHVWKQPKARKETWRTVHSLGSSERPWP